MSLLAYRGIPIAPVVMIALLALTVGCAAPATEPIWAAPADMITVPEAARRLRMTVTQASAYSARLSDGRNELIVVGPPHNTAWLNGRQLVNKRIASSQQRLFVGISLVDDVARGLASPPPTAAHPPPVDWRRVPVSGTVVLDAGHGGSDPGAPNAHGPREKIITLDTTLRVRDLLQQRGIRVVLTRGDDSYPTLDQRIALSNRTQPKLFVSIHADAAENRAAKGFTVYAAREASAHAITAAEQMVAALKATGAASRGVRRANFKVISEPRAPAILVEMGYLSNADEARLLSTPQYRQRMAEAIAEGVVRALARMK